MLPLSPDVIITPMGWYLRYKLSYRDVEDLLAERGVATDHSTVNRWVIKFSPALADAARAHKNPVGRSWRLDETYISRFVESGSTSPRDDTHGPDEKLEKEEQGSSPHESSI